MRKVAEIMYIIPEEREAFLKASMNPDEDTLKALWVCGVRNQAYFEFGEFIVMSFDYAGNNFAEDVKEMSALLASKGVLIKDRRRDVPENQRETTNWWAPIKRLGVLLSESPIEEKEEASMEEMYRNMLSGYMTDTDITPDTLYDDDDWSESVHL